MIKGKIMSLALLATQGMEGAQEIIDTYLDLDEDDEDVQIISNEEVKNDRSNKSSELLRRSSSSNG